MAAAPARREADLQVAGETQIGEEPVAAARPWLVVFGSVLALTVATGR